MTNISDKKYYWLKLKRDFFKRHDIQIIESMPNGKDYVLFYLKLLVESVDHNGTLRFSDTIPYNEQMLSTITNTNIDVVRAAMKVFTELKMIEVFDDQTIYLAETQKMLGTETYWAEQKRKQRISGQCPENVPLLSNVSNQELDIDKDKENISSEVGKPTPDKPIFEKDSKPYKCAEFLAKKLTERIPNKKIPETHLQTWAADFDKANRIDGHSWDDIGEVLTFSQDDSFWQINILSGAKFRKQYDQLYLKMQKES